MSNTIRISCLLAGLLLTGLVMAAEPATYDRIGFTVSAEKEVENDVLTASLFASEAGQDAATLSDRVNQDIAWALAIAQQEDAIESRTLGYTTNPVYKDGRVDGWQVRQSLELKSKDSKQLSTLLGQLQNKLQVQSVTYSLSGEVRRSTEEMLISEALAAFKNRASQVQANMERHEYRVVRLNINTASDSPPHRSMAMARSASMMMAESAPAAPSLDGGKQKVRVTIDAEIELSVN